MNKCTLRDVDWYFSRKYVVTTIDNPLVKMTFNPLEEKQECFLCFAAGLPPQTASVFWLVQVWIGNVVCFDRTQVRKEKRR